MNRRCATEGLSQFGADPFSLLRIFCFAAVAGVAGDGHLRITVLMMRQECQKPLPVKQAQSYAEFVLRRVVYWFSPGKGDTFNQMTFLFLQFVFLQTCFTWACSNQKLLLSYGSLVSSVILIVVRIWLFMHLLKVYKNFGFGLADSGKELSIRNILHALYSNFCCFPDTAFIGLATETTRLLMRSPNYRQRLELWKGAPLTLLTLPARRPTEVSGSTSRPPVPLALTCLAVGLKQALGWLQEHSMHGFSEGHRRVQ